MKKPNALFIGPQRSGTTWVHRYLESRGDICLPHGVKETMFFDCHFDRGEDWYKRHFKNYSQAMHVLEVAPTLFDQTGVPERVFATLGAIPLVCTLRDPSERSYSLYLHMRRYGMTRCVDFRSAVAKHPKILTSSFYAAHLSRWISVFGSSRMLVLFQDDLALQKDEYVRALCAHLGLPYIKSGSALQARVNGASLPFSPALATIGQTASDALRGIKLYSVVNFAKSIGLKNLFFGSPGKNPPEITVDERRWVIEQLLSDIESLELLLHRDLSHWKRW